MKKNKEYSNFADALQKVLSVSHSELKSRLAQDKKSRKQNAKKHSASRVSRVSHATD